MSKIIFNGVDYAGGSGNYFNPVIYSDTERKIGVWRDNKPLYAKTINITTPSVANAIVSVADVTSLNIDTVVSLDGNYNDTNINWSLNIYFNTGRSANCFVNGGKTAIMMLVNDNVAMNKNAYVTIKYTKTTDVAGSGDYNTLGVPTEHYSTNEQVVGTWIDGKPLYKKTYQFNSTVWLNANGWTNGINIDTTVVKVLVDAEVLRTIGAYSFYGYLQVVPYNNLLNIFNCRNTNMEIDTITLVYTKTTD